MNEPHGRDPGAGSDPTADSGTAEASEQLPTPGLVTPRAAGERNALIDALRGCAVLGILAANIIGMLVPIATLALDAALFPGTLDRAANGVLTFLATGKFFVLFSMLFGLGFSLQLRRLEARGAAAGQIFRRRLLLLWVIGLLHVVLLWAGDILMLYAAAGGGLFFLRHWSSRAALRATLMLYGAGIVLFGLLLAPAAFAGPAEDSAGALGMIQWLKSMYLQSYWDAVRARGVDYLFNLIGLIFIAPVVFGYFLFGMAAERANWIARLSQDARLRRRWLAGLSIPAVVLNGLAAYWLNASAVAPALVALGDWLIVVAGPLLSLTFALLLIAAWDSPRGRVAVGVLTPVGRMALTNYILQSAIVTLIANGYGLGQMGRIGPAGALALIPPILLLQIVCSHLWMRRFQYGPLEWLWRMGTYGRSFPIARAPAASAAETV